MVQQKCAFLEVPKRHEEATEATMQSMQHSQFKNQKSAPKCTPLHQNAAYFKTAERELRVSQRHPKPNHHNTALAKAVRADHSQYPKGTRFPIQ